MIERNTTIPTKKAQIYSTASDSQPSVDIRILQGERPMAKDNKVLGNFRLDGIPPAPRGMPQIEVTYDIDANGILHVTAKDMGTGRDQKISITNSSGLSQEEIDKMREEAEAHAAEDSKLKEEVETRNKLDTLIYQTEKLIKENGDKIPDDKKKTIEELIKEAPNSGRIQQCCTDECRFGKASERQDAAGSSDSNVCPGADRRCTRSGRNRFLRGS